jgi:polyisoprenyl-teichoic acid--peptidoglycan teichoic acid transferase
MRRRVIASLTAVAVVAVIGGAGLARRGSKAPPRRAGNAAAVASKPTTMLVMTVRAGDVSGQADTLALFSFGGAAQPFVMLIPSGTLTDIPGYGFDIAGRALSFGRVGLATVSVENMIGVRVDHTVVLDQSSLASLVDKMGGIKVTVKQALYAPDSQGRLVPVFSAGAQSFDGRKTVKYLTYQGAQETELARLERQQDVWEGIFAQPGSADMKTMFSSMEDKVDGDVSAADAGAFLASFAAVPAAGRTYDGLPVSAAGAADDQAFKIEEDDLNAQVQHYLAAERTWTVGPRPRLQLLNGNGAPEAGVSVAEKLVPAGYFLVDTGNSRSFDFGMTQIVVYSDDAASMKMAQQIRTLLGRGEITVDRRPQTGVDVTVVIGRDLKSA